ncbi:ATP-binding protein [Streptomyces yanii]|uniref:ATP-binding protein n=1 Tax=Streptomyces yanii TaxID=78510 RepID=A0ABV5R5G4_9ACTN
MRTLQESRSYVTSKQSTQRRKNPLATGPGTQRAQGNSRNVAQINQRYLKSSTILTTNVGIADWAGAFGDATVAAAMLDRLLHRAAVVGIDGPSYRLRSHQSHADNLRKGVTGRAG